MPKRPDYLEKLLEGMREDMQHTRQRQYDLNDQIADFKLHVSNKLDETHKALESRLVKLENRVTFWERTALAVWAGITTVVVGTTQFITSNAQNIFHFFKS